MTATETGRTNTDTAHIFKRKTIANSVAHLKLPRMRVGLIHKDHIGSVISDFGLRHVCKRLQGSRDTLAACLSSVHTPPHASTALAQLHNHCTGQAQTKQSAVHLCGPDVEAIEVRQLERELPLLALLIHDVRVQAIRRELPGYTEMVWGAQHAEVRLQGITMHLNPVIQRSTSG